MCLCVLTDEAICESTFSEQPASQILSNGLLSIYPSHMLIDVIRSFLSFGLLKCLGAGSVMLADAHVFSI